ncbi:CobW family GTP-binding protein [Pseudomonas sp. BP8]|uniref:CobW family GTP-binding protein n=1 Tax=Pseudomonas sp. BP8 TaxID=2817864 RepID=UPI001AE1C25A|nr:CobW family GTP-binding protein [Pseudomonas sp. BP8]MBP2259679.1 G3E family GTPase [Pseudomonas sp. BP8]HDS1734926.1 cobalamin biosynthesis protein CobW [Pseudomonas putida]
MLRNIPTHVIAGPLGAGKTSLIRHLLEQRPPTERWAVLVNEFGQIGLDAALLTRDEDGVAIGEVAGGCLCCVNGTPFQVGLGRLLRKAKPDRVFIEPSGLGHPLQLLHQLGEAPWLGVLSVQPLIMVLDAQALARAEPLPEAQREAVSAAGLLIFNKSGAVEESRRLLISNEFINSTICWTEYGKVAFERLQFSTSGEEPGVTHDLPVEKPTTPSVTVWTDPSAPICLAQQGEGGWSIGWRWHASQHFDRLRVERFLRAWPWRRAKGVIHSGTGWQSFNGLGGNPVAWQPSEWRKDSRVELIFDLEQPAQALQAALAACRDQR